MISTLSVEHEDNIASMLAAYFHDHNTHLGRSYFKEDEAIMKKHVHERLTANGPIQYIGWMEGDDLKGFINFFDNTNARMVEIWAVVGPTLESTQINALLEHCKNMVQEKGYKGISLDIADHEIAIRDAFVTLGGWKKTNSYMM